MQIKLSQERFCMYLANRDSESCWNRPLPSSKNPHFQNEARCTTFPVKMSFLCNMRMKNDFHIKGCMSTYPRFETEAWCNSEMA